MYEREERSRYENLGVDRKSKIVDVADTKIVSQTKERREKDQALP
jgi:hypothetical protein